MSFLQTLLLGTISGLTIFLGMPLARLKAMAKEHLSFLNAVAIGVLFFLFVDVVTHATEPLEIALTHHQADFWLLTFLLIFGMGMGLLGLIYYGKHFLKKEPKIDLKNNPFRLAILIAIGIGLHNFSEGLAIGNSAHGGEIKLAILLIVGFGLHNITEAFAIAAPLAGQKAPWRLLGITGLIAGGPNFLGTILGYVFFSESLSVLFLALAAGAILYVIGELLAVGRKFEAHAWMGWGLLFGFFAGLLTDFILVVVGA